MGTVMIGYEMHARSEHKILPMNYYNPHSPTVYYNPDMSIPYYDPVLTAAPTGMRSLRVKDCRSEGLASVVLN